MSKGVFLFLHNGLKMVLKCSEKEKDPGKFLLLRQKSFFLELNTSSALLPKPAWRLWDLQYPGCLEAASQAHLDVKIQPWNLWAPRLELNLCHHQSEAQIHSWASPRDPNAAAAPPVLTVIFRAQSRGSLLDFQSVFIAAALGLQSKLRWY